MADLESHQDTFKGLHENLNVFGADVDLVFGSIAHYWSVKTNFLSCFPPLNLAKE